jgi:hypothetical protein
MCQLLAPQEQTTFLFLPTNEKVLLYHVTLGIYETDIVTQPIGSCFVCHMPRSIRNSMVKYTFF